MKWKTITIFILLSITVIIFSDCAGKTSDVQKKSENQYFGQTPPGTKAVIFAPDIISLPDRQEHQIVFSPDGNECYFSGRMGNSGKIYYSKSVGNIWTEPAEVLISGDHSFGLSGLSIDGNKLFLEKENNIWIVKRNGEEWGVPHSLPSPINSTGNDHSYSESINGDIYLGSSRPGGLDKKFEIWRMRPNANSTYNVENLGPVINSTLRNLTPCISPDGSYLIFTQSDTTYEHLYITFKTENDGWTKPINMDKSGAEINTLFQTRPTLSPDGKYLFFNKHIPYGKADIYWVSTSIIPELKEIAFAQ